MDDKQIALTFGIAERPVKLLLNSYFALFKKSDLLDVCEKMGISTKKIPLSYSKHGELAGLVASGELPTSFLQHDSLLKVPPKSGEINFTTKFEDKENKTYALSLDIVSNTLEWNEELFAPFGDDVKTVKGFIGRMMNMSHYVFACLKKCNPELETIILEADSKNVTLKIKDSRVPNYDHPKRIGFKISEAELIVEDE